MGGSLMLCKVLFFLLCEPIGSDRICVIGPKIVTDRQWNCTATAQQWCAGEGRVRDGLSTGFEIAVSSPEIIEV
jgi:hypothetical protein